MILQRDPSVVMHIPSIIIIQRKDM
jgi:hypothetical protein